ncbi:BTB/POZ domain-containing protein KCTD19 isoform X2 [Oncorhynchus kisutch]|uniref:BTB/POZ domain-containing protein KCTD19 isoform X2 n=1 Tax=Oncorhynchus kisutch TaxID=8019 RepID=UPI0012DE2E06|nr:BTB/POZ domain-containing protein KCTD19-like isoform X2 [Oncorhynchus kisutch]
METEQDNQFCSFNVGGCFFSIRFNRLSHLQDSLLFKDTSSGQKPRWFIDRDGCTFRHVQYYLQTGKLATSCVSELNILYELTAGLRLTSLLQALENLQSGKHFLRDRPVDLQVTERATLNYWKTRICNTREPEPVASPVSSVHDAVPLGLVGTPLVDGDEEVLYCFVPMETVRLYPALVTPHNLLWLCDDLVVIECDSSLFRFIANYLQTGNIFLPEDFSDHDRLNQEAGAAGMTDFLEELQKRPELIGDDIMQPQDGCPQMKQQPQHRLTPQPLYIMTFDLLVRYQDSALGQLCVDSNVEGSRLHLSGNGVVFQHVANWLGTCRVPLTERQCELPGLCEYLDRQDEAYHTFRDALWEFLHRTRTTGRCFTAGPWSASVATFSIYKVVKVYVGTHWYATYYKTLFKHPELLSNPRKSSWIVFGHSLQIRADGAMFRHILNFLRCGRLLLPSVFKEWRLLCNEVEEFQIPALTGALEDCSDYRAWCESNTPAAGNQSSSSAESLLFYNQDQDVFTGIGYQPESMDVSPSQTQHGVSPEDSFISVGEDICPLVEPENELRRRDCLLQRLEESRQVNTEDSIEPSQLSPAPLQSTVQSGGQTSQLSVPSDRLSQNNTTSDTSSKLSSSPLVPNRTLDTMDIRKLSSSLCSVTHQLDHPSKFSPTGLSSPGQKPVGSRHFSSPGRYQGGLVERATPDGLDEISASLQSMMAETVFQSGPNTQPWGSPSGEGTLCPCTGSRGSTPDPIPPDPLPNPASARLSTLTAFLARQGLPGGAQGTRYRTQRADVEGESQGRSTVKPNSSTQREDFHWSRPALGGCLFPVRGCVLRVDHPPVLGRGEPGGYFTQSLIYTASPPHTGYGADKDLNVRGDIKSPDVAFACFNVSWEDMVFGRQCHVFLTGLILDSIRLEDSKDCTLKITNLVYFLWTGQVKAEDFVSELLRIICSERREKSREQQLLQWLEFSLPLAQRYSDCLEQLDRGHCRTVSLFP